jgi:uncharacterized protein YggL (DUF469 family)
MGTAAALVSQLHASLGQGCRPKDAEKMLRSLEEELLIPRGLYLDGGLQDSGDGADASPEIAGLVTRADGRDLSERDVTLVATWLGKQPAIAEFSMGPLKSADR